MPRDSITTSPVIKVAPADEPRTDFRTSSAISVAELLSSMPKEKAEALRQKIDQDKNGFITVTELGYLFEELEEEEEKVKVFRTGLIVATLMLLLSIAANAGMTFAVVELSKETEAGSDGTLTTRNGTTIKTASTAFTVSTVTHPVGSGLNATTTVGVTSSLSGRRRRSDITTEESSVMKDNEGRLLKVGVEEVAKQKTQLTSELSDETFHELDMLSIKGADGQVNFKVQGWARYTQADSRCGSVVVLYTTPGQVQFDGVAMTFDENVKGAFARAGFRVTPRRRGRRSESQDGYSLKGVQEVFGQFRFLADNALDLSQLSCGDDRPMMKSPFGDAGFEPSKVSWTETLMVGCGQDGQKPCPADTVNTLTFNDQSYFYRTTSTIAKKVQGKWYQITEMSAPDMPGYSVVSATDGTQTLHYTRTPDGYESRCQTKNGTNTGSSAVMGDGDADAPNDETEEDIGEDEVFEANSPIPGKSPILDFVGYDVLNGEYVRHFKITFPAADATTDYYEHYNENRLFAMPFDAEDAIQTYDNVSATDFSAATEMSGDGYPTLPGDDGSGADTFLALPASCDTNTAHTFVDMMEYQMEVFVQEDWQKKADALTEGQKAVRRELREARMAKARRAEYQGKESKPVLGEIAIPSSDLDLNGDGAPVLAENHEIVFERDGNTTYIFSRNAEKRVRARRANKNKKVDKNKKDSDKEQEQFFDYCADMPSTELGLGRKKLLKGACVLGGIAVTGQCAHYLEFYMRCNKVLRRNQPFVQVGGGITVTGGTYHVPYTGWEVDCAIQGCAWIHIKHRMLGTTCSARATVCIEYSFWNDEVTLSGELGLRCGGVSAQIGAEITWGKAFRGAMFPKLVSGFAVSVRGCLDIEHRHCWRIFGKKRCKTWRVRTCVGNWQFAVSY